MPESEKKFIKKIHFESISATAESLARISKDETRAVVLIVENFAETNDEQFYETLENFPVPVILALKNSAGERFVAACHLCVAAETARVGNSAATEALKKGSINKTAPLERIEAEAFSLAEKISQIAPLAVRACLKAVIGGGKLSLAEGLKLETELFAEIFSTADMREGTRAFLEKRRPNFQGK
jgi:enoyl-CoA hydratase/carnithine racemase